MNMDQRSLKLHKELMVWVFDKGFAMQVADAFSEDMTKCREVTLDDMPVGRPPQEVPQPGGPALLQRALTRRPRRP